MRKRWVLMILDTGLHLSLFLSAFGGSQLWMVASIIGVFAFWLGYATCVDVNAASEDRRARLQQLADDFRAGKLRV